MIHVTDENINLVSGGFSITSIGTGADRSSHSGTMISWKLYMDSILLQECLISRDFVLM